MLSATTLDLFEQYKKAKKDLYALHDELSAAIEKDTGIVLCDLATNSYDLHLWSADPARKDVLALAETEPAVKHVYDDGSKGYLFSLRGIECMTIAQEDNKDGNKDE